MVVMMNIILILILAVPTFVCVNIALWFFGVRPYIHRHGRVCITAANWGYSMWADLTTAWSIGKEEGRFPLCVKLLLALQVFEILFLLLMLVGRALL